MPELPDVETFASYLKKKALHLSIQSVEVKTPRILKKVSKAQFERSVKNHRFCSVKRVGKYLFLAIGEGKYVVVHFGMTGFVYVFKEKNPFSAHTRVIFHFKEKQLAYVNQRLFGFLSLTDSIETYTHSLGPDALAITKPAFQPLFERGTLKAILMDQHKIAGIGNVYCDEILYHAHFHPKRHAASLSKKEIDRLYASMKSVLKRAIEARGDSDRMPATWLIQARQNNTPCPRCGRLIHQIKSGGRSTYYCPKCQKENG